jgi:hypothetical protein
MSVLWLVQRHTPSVDARRTHDSDSYNRWGTRGLYELFERQGFDARAWRGRLDRLGNRQRMIFILSPSRHFVTSEVDGLLAWVEAGGTAVLAPSRHTTVPSVFINPESIAPIEQLLGPMGLFVEHGPVLAGDAPVTRADSLLEDVDTVHIPSHLRIVTADAARLRQEYEKVAADRARYVQARAGSCSGGACDRGEKDDAPKDEDRLRRERENAAAESAERMKDGADSREDGEAGEDERDDAPAETVVIAPFLADYLQPRLRPEQFTTLASLDDRAVVGLIRHGEGRIIVLAEADMLGNYWIDRADNVMLALNAAYTSGARAVYFDEFHHGSSLLSMEAEEARASAAWRVIRFVLLGVAVFVIAQGVRFGSAVPRYRRARRSAREFVDALAGLYQQAGASRAAIRILVGDLKRLVARAASIGAAPGHATFPNERLAHECALRNPGIDEQALLALLNRLDAAAYAPRRLDDAELVRLGRAASRMEKELLRGASGSATHTRARPTYL